jgi:hypothetical protein
MAARARSDAPRPRARSDAYVGLLVLALLAQIAGGVFLYLEYSSYPEMKPAAVKVQDAPPRPVAPPGGQQQGGQQMGGQQMGGQQMGMQQMGAPMP